MYSFKNILNATDLYALKIVNFMFCESYLKKKNSGLEIALREGEKNIQYKKTKPGLVNEHGVGWGETLQRSIHLTWRIHVCKLVRNMVGDVDFR